MELVLLVISVCCMIWGIYNYSEVQKIEFRSEKAFMEMAREIENLRNELRRAKNNGTIG